MIAGIDHVLLAAPPGSEAALREFYTGALGMTELTKPPVLAARGGCWFQSGTAVLHLGIEDGYRPPAKAHPGILVEGLYDFAKRLESHGVQPVWDYDLPAHNRFYATDPVGNRLEFLEPIAVKPPSD